MILEKYCFGIYFFRLRIIGSNGTTATNDSQSEKYLNNKKDLQYTKAYQKSKERNDKIGIQKTRNKTGNKITQYKYRQI